MSEVYEQQQYRHAQQMRELVDEVSRRPFTATSKDGLISVRALATGQVVALEIDPRIYRNPNSKALAESILTTLEQAIAGAAKIHLASIATASGVDVKTFAELLDGAANLVASLMDEADDLNRQNQR
ncbi:YbaB/EbfC family nucleoid-associated protein [Spirillospora sp. NPDC029432]|uniref:YbaB/EbfC family nucleoid-associated protein n=1 Tax=Spirillospora sp. NPDC029432 TaxID=3154599 RepID=UPI00345455DB